MCRCRVNKTLTFSFRREWIGFNRLIVGMCLKNQHEEETMRRTLRITTVIFLLGIMVGGGASAGAADLGLVKMLTSNLGVTEKQASGGAGSIFNLAKQNLGAQDFTRVADAVPGIDKMMAAAPKAEGAAGMLGGASSLLGGGAPSVSGVAGLAGSFSQLGMNAGMVNSFVPIVLNYVKSSGGETVMNILQSALK